jgi:hypothetical protein
MVYSLQHRTKIFVSPAAPRIPWFKHGAVRFLLQSLVDAGVEKITDEFPLLLLVGMDMYLGFSKEYRRNIEDLDGKYVFRIGRSDPPPKGAKKKKGGDEFIILSAAFRRGEMYVKDEELKEWDIRVTFQDAAGMRSFLFSDEGDMLDAILKNEVRTEGNLNYLYKFGYMARYLCKRVDTLFYSKERKYVP